MSRPLRIEYENAWYHVMNRGAAKQATFLNKAHYELFLEVLSEVCHRFQIELHAYCLMPNHYHLLIRTPLANLSKAMRHLNGVYTQRFNLMTARDGALFRGRYKAVLVESETYLARLSRYIHLNPVKAAIVRKPEAYSWSSYRYYLNENNMPDWLTTKETLSRFDKRSDYDAFIREGIDSDIDKFYEGPALSPILGSEGFTKKITETYLNHEPNHEIHQHKDILKKQLPSIDDVFNKVCAHYDVSLKEAKSRIHQQKNTARAVAVILSSEKAQASFGEIATYLGNVSYPAVAKIIARIRDDAKSNQRLTKDLKKIGAQL